MSRSKNRFDVQVVVADATIGIKNRPDREPTPEMVLDALEDFCARMRRALAQSAEYRRQATEGR